MFKFGRKRRLCSTLETMRPDLYRIAWSWCHDDAQAEDLVQDTCVKALEKLDQLRNPERLRPWVLRIMANLHRDHYRGRRDIVTLSAHDEELAATDPGPAEAAERNATVVMVHRAITSLGDDQRKVLTLVDVGGFSYAEVAEALEIPIGTVMSRLSRARVRLRRELMAEKEEITGLRCVK